MYVPIGLLTLEQFTFHQKRLCHTENVHNKDDNVENNLIVILYPQISPSFLNAPGGTLFALIGMLYEVTIMVVLSGVQVLKRNLKIWSTILSRVN